MIYLHEMNRAQRAWWHPERQELHLLVRLQQADMNENISSLQRLPSLRSYQRQAQT